MPKDEVEVQQCDRDAAAPILRLYGAENYALLCERGFPWCDKLAVVQTIAKVRLAAEAKARAEVEDLRTSVVAFAGPFAARYAKDYGMADGELHPVHYDLLQKCGARMDDFRRAILERDNPPEIKG